MAASVSAAASPPLPSSSSPSSSTTATLPKNRTNYTRICRLLTDIGTKVLRGVLDSLQPPAGLQKHLSSPAVYNKLKNLRTKKILNTQQWDKLFPPSGAPSSSSFDITLLFLLLRNICGLTAPSTGWDAAPLPTDAGKEADLIRVKRCRNEITAHSTVAELSDTDFETHWNEIEAALVRLGGLHYEPDIQRLKIESIDPENEAFHRILLLAWEEGEEKKMDTILEKLDKITMEIPSKDSPREIDALVRPSQWPSTFCNLPQKPSHDAINRELEVSFVIDKIERLSASYPNHITVTYLSGNPGCGKSELARQIGEKYFDCNEEEGLPKLVATLNAPNLETLTQSYMDLACELHCSETSITAIITSELFSQDQKLAQLRGLVFPKLHSYSSWLMIIDNVEDLQLVSKYIPHAGQKLHHGKGHILVTTQDSQAIPRSDSHAHHESLSNGMNQEDAVRSLNLISGFPDERENAFFVAKKLDSQPLALACAAVYVRLARIADPSFNWERYLSEIERGNKELTERIFQKQSPSYGKSMTSAVKMAVEKETEKSEIMHHTFVLLAAMAPDLISLNHIISYVSMCMPDEDEHSIAAEVMTSSLVLTSENKSERAVARVHQIVHYVLQAIYRKMATQSVDEFSFFLKITNVFSYIKGIDCNSVEYISATLPLTGHFISLTEKVKDFFDSHHVLKRTDSDALGVTYRTDKLFTHQYMPIAMFLKDVVAEVFVTQRNYNTSRVVLEMSYALIEKNDGDQLQKTGEVLCALGGTLRRLKENHAGEEAYRKALAINSAIFGDDDPVVAKSLSGLGNILRSSGKFNEAQTCHEKALGINQAKYGNNHPEVATNHSDLGNVFYGLGKYESAKECHEKSLAIRKTIYDENHPMIATSLNNLATVMRCLCEYKDSTEFYKRALSINQAIYGSGDHFSSVKNVTNLGTVLTDLGRFEEAKECHQRSLAFYEKTFGKKHANVGIVLEKLGTTLHGLGEIDNARECFDKSLAILENTYGKDHPRVARTLNSLAQLQLIQGETEEAKRNLDRALAINGKSFDGNHPEVAVTLNNLGKLCNSLHDYEQAREHFERALDIQEKIFASHHPRIAITLHNLGDLLDKMEKHENAQRCLERARIIQEKYPDFNYKF